MSTRTENQSVKLTKSGVEKVPPPATGQTFIRDSELKGFGLRITAGGARSFIVEKRIAGKVRRMTLGRFGEITVVQARKEAQKLLGKVATGGNPIADKQEQALRSVTLNAAFEAFKQAHKGLKPRTLYDYERVMVVAFPDWRERSFCAITKDMVGRRHRELGEQRGKAYANLAMRFLRSLLNFAREQYELPDGRVLMVDNPVERLTRTRAWYHIERRQGVIKRQQFPAWYRAVESLRDDDTLNGSLVADYLLLVLYTGLRASEAARIRWREVDLDAAILTIPDTKNRQPLILPLSDFLQDTLERRRLDATGDFVFPGAGKHRYLNNPRKQIAKVIERSGVTFTLHDLRRTYITAAESLDISAYAIKRLVNHKTAAGDVTAGYIIMAVERLRAPMQKITDYILREMGIKKLAPVTAIDIAGAKGAHSNV